MKWVKDRNIKIEIRRSISIRETRTNIDIDLFSDASITGICTVAYVVIYQSNNISQDVIKSKNRLANRNLTIPRLELIVSQMSANLSENIKNALSNQNVRNF